MSRYSNIAIPQERTNYDDWDYTNLCELYCKHEWLSKQTNHEGFEQLWFDLRTKQDKLIIKKLLHNFIYLTQEDAEVDLVAGLKLCFDMWGTKPDNTIITAVRQHPYADGSNYLLQFLKSALVELNEGWNEKNLISKLSDGIRYASNGRMEQLKISKIILIDDFVGTGKTAEERIKEVIKKLSESKNPNVEIYFFSLAGMKFGIKRAKQAGIPVHSIYSLNKGIKLSFSTRKKKIKARLLDMENLLATEVDKKLLIDHSLGWGEAQALYCWNRDNIPNNVFPIFWWKKYYNNSTRKTLFNRMQ